MSGDFTRIGRNISVLDRLMKMYYERGLAEFEIGWGQQFQLEFIYDHPGVSPQQIADYYHVDKATITKILKKLCAVHYIKVETDSKDKRVRHLYIDKTAVPTVQRIKQLHKEFYGALTGGLPSTVVERTENNMEEMIQNLSQKIWHRMEDHHGKRNQSSKPFSV